jgi:hypothetical protein
VEQLLRLEEDRIRSMEALEHEQRLRKAFVDRHRKRNEERCRVVPRVRSKGAGPPGSWTKECRREGEREGGEKQRDG